VRGRRLATSRLAVVEVVKACGRANPAADAGAILALFAFVEIDAELALVAAHAGGPTIRSLDALHVASALRLGGEVEAFVTYDRRQAEAAVAAGLRVTGPGQPALPGPERR
jgi:hypothetical protein